MKRTLEDAWHEVSQYLDEILERGREERQACLDQIEARAPDIAAQLRECLIELAQLEERDFLGGCSAAVLPEATLAGQRLGSYTLDRSLGHGGMGTVWLAHRSDGRFEGQVAVKLLNAALIGHPSEQRFAREGSVLARLRHPNIAHLLDAGVAQGRQPYLILEYVEGERIDWHCEKARLSVEQRVALFLDVLAAVAHAHSNLIVHRDLKPSNILVTGHGVVKLLDFGVAALLSPAAAESASGQLTHHAAPGLTPAYAAPEQLLGGSITTATDVYALGLVLFVLLTGRHPALPESKTPAELMRLTVDTEAPRASEIAMDVSRGRLLRGDLDNIIAMALRKNPADRYTTVDLFAQDLRRYLTLEPVSARPSSFRYRATKFACRHRGGVAAVIAITVVLVCAVAVTTREMLEARQQRDQAHYQSRRAELTRNFLELLMLSDGGPDRPALSVHERLELGVDLLNKQYRGDPKFVGRMTLELAMNFSKHDDTRRANELYEQAYAIGRQTHDTELMVYAQCYQAYEEAYADINDDVARIEEAERLLREIDNADATLQADCLMARARVQQRRGDTGSAEALLRRGLSILEANGRTDHASYVYLLDELGNIYLARNQPREVLQIDRRVGDLLDRNGRGGTATRLIYRQNEAVSLNAMGEISEALAQLEVITQRMRELETPGQEPFPYRFNYATSLLRMAKPARALQALQGVLDRAQQTGNPHAIRQTLFLTGSTFLELARWDEAAAALNEAALMAANGTGNENLQAQIESLRARLDLARGDIDAAHRHRDMALKFAGYRTEKPLRALARVLLVATEVALAEGAGADAERFAGEALAISEPVARGPDTSADVGEALLRLAQTRVAAAGVGADTKSILQRAVRSLTNGLESDHPLTREARNLLENTEGRAVRFSRGPATAGSVLVSNGFGLKK